MNLIIQIQFLDNIKKCFQICIKIDLYGVVKKILLFDFILFIRFLKKIEAGIRW